MLIVLIAIVFRFTAQHRGGARPREEAVWTESGVHLRGWAAEAVGPPQVSHHDGGETSTRASLTTTSCVFTSSSSFCFFIFFVLYKLKLSDWLQFVPAAIHLLLHRLGRPPHHYSTALADSRPTFRWRRHCYLGRPTLPGWDPVATDMGRPAGRQAGVAYQADLSRHTGQRVGKPYLTAGPAWQRHGLPRATAARTFQSHLQRR